MFIKISRSKNFKYVQLVRAYREDGKVKHEVLIKLGKLDQLENNTAWQKVAMKLAEIARAKSTNIETCSEATNRAPRFSWFDDFRNGQLSRKSHIA